MPIRVAEFVTRLEFGGVEAMLLNYTTHFQHPEQFEFHVITQDINDDNCIRQFENAGYTVHVVTHKRKSIAKNIREVCQVLKQERFDIVHSHMTLTNFYVLFLAKMLGVRVRISHAHSAFREDNLKAKLSFPFLKWLNCVTANIWVACGYNAGVFLYGKNAVDSHKVYMMRNAIDLQHFQRNDKIRKMIREKYAIGDGLCVGHIGRFSHPKNHFFVLEIFDAVRKIVPEASFLLLGDGELRDEIIEKIKELHLEASVVLTGNVTNTNEFYQAMDAFILPSFYEGLPVVSIEAQAADLPCLISENVDHHCAITSKIRFLSIQKSADEWAREILKCVALPHTDDNIGVLTKAGYNIETEARKLEELYKSSINE
ncbi:glycosyltransferase [Baileyella intestinalis]|uniref:glycosyltransferase n=1 Tax=Baileyella intestinalis TaxID=2606709 RepID=UPI0022E051FA|nr:glycosyltransferase [Baileyella intestinalis]